MREFAVRVHDVSPANGAIDVGAKPSVDAGNMERVPAFREQTDKLPVAKLAEAHGTIGGAVEEAVAGPILRHGDGSDGGLVKADGPDVPHVVERLPVVKGRVIVVSIGIRVNKGSGADGAAAATEDGVVGKGEE